MKIEESEITPIRIFAATDENYAQHMAVMMASVLANNSSRSPIEFYIIDGGLKEETKVKINSLKKSFNLENSYLKIDTSSFKKFPTDEHLTPAAYYRLAIPELVSASIEKALYLDCDLIVRADLRDLWDLDLGEFWFAAAGDCLNPSTITRLNMPSSANYFNSGVMLMDLKRLRENRSYAQVIQFIIKNPDLVRLCDQDALNSLFFDKWLQLHPKWNVSHLMLSRSKGLRYDRFCPDELESAVKHPHIVHFTGCSKPWNFKSRHPYTAEYYQYLSLTDWKDYRPHASTFDAAYGMIPLTDLERGRKFRQVGWALPEKNFVWTASKEVFLALGYLPASLQMICMRCAPFIGKGMKGQRVIIWVGDQLAGEFFVDREMMLRFPVNRLEGEKSTIVRLLLPDATPPFETGFNDDIRCLGLVIRSMEMLPVADSHLWGRVVQWWKKLW